MKTTLLLALLPLALCMSAQGTISNPGSVRISIPELTEASAALIQKAGIDLHCGADVQTIEGKMRLTLDCSTEELNRLLAYGVKADILIYDVQKYYAERNRQMLPDARLALEQKKATPVRNASSAPCEIEEFAIPVHFTLGDYGGFLYYQQILDMLDSMAEAYPQLISTRKPVSDSLLTRQGREVYWVKISNHPNSDENEPEVLYTALTHAREPGSAMSLLYYMWYLLENYASDPGVRALVDRTEMYFIPVVNPDGYLYNAEIAPDGGGMWRKNLHDNDNNGIIDSKDGVDLNRNYGYLWGYDEVGSSSIPSYSTYRGEAAFSEPETRMIRDFVLAHDFGVAMHDHSYGNDLYTPWDHGPDVLPDASLIYRMSERMTTENRYHFGQTHSTYWLGPTNGSANDWFYGDEDEKSKIFCWIPEIGPAFWPPPTEIVEICQKQMRTHLEAAKFAGYHVQIHDLSKPGVKPGQNALQFRIENLGLANGDLTIVTMPRNGNILSAEVRNPGAMLAFDGPLETRDIYVDIAIDSRLTSGSTIDFDIIVEVDGTPIETLHVSKYVDPVIGLGTSATSDISNWDPDHWGFQMSGSPASSWLTDSPGGSQYNELNTLHWLPNIDLTNVSWASATCIAKWSIETKNDFVQVQARAANMPWKGLCGKYTRPGAVGNQIDIPSPHAGQPLGEPVFDGHQTFPVREEFDLSEYIGYDHVELRIVAWSGALVSEVVEDGFYFKDFEIYTSRDLHCGNGTQDGDEEGLDCGGTDCAPCATCSDGILNGDEEDVDCGGGCTPCASCTDGIQNGNETGIDCGGDCTTCATCSDGIQNGSETGVDCGGDCAACAPTCQDGIQNGDETGVDCGGTCPLVCRTRCCDKENRIWYDSGLPELFVVPNPVTGIFQVVTEKSTGLQDLRWEITNVMGAPILHSGGFVDAISIDASELPGGIYFIRIHDQDNNVWINKFIKQ